MVGRIATNTGQDAQQSEVKHHNQVLLETQAYPAGGLLWAKSNRCERLPPY